MERVDIAIIGTGPAGVSAAITAKVRNKSVLLIGSRELSESSPVSHLSSRPPSLLRLRAATFSERALNDASIISKVFFSIDTISIYQNI